MNSSSIPALENVRVQPHLLNATVAIVLTAWLGDFLFWWHEPGISVGIFAVLLGLGIWGIGSRAPRSFVPLALLLVSAGQSATELCFTNLVCLGVFLIAIAGEVYYSAMPGLWARWSEAFAGVILAPLRWASLLVAWGEVRTRVRRSEGAGTLPLGRLLVAVLPAAAVAVIFSLLLGAGNAVFADLFSGIWNAALRSILDFSLVRTVLWVLWFFVGVALFWPISLPEGLRFWVQKINPWPRRDMVLAKWQSALVLAVVNGLFFIANTIDAIYLWADAKLPAGVTPSSFVHSGVYALIAATVLAGGLLALIFQQEAAVSRSSWLRGLALAWIAQNLVLIVGVVRRLGLYVEAYQLSELRVYAGCFLLLVSVGFALLAWHVWFGLKLEKLIFNNALATLGLFFILQFCDVGTWVANWNVARWKADSTRKLDLEYLEKLGPRGWPALLEVAQHRPQFFFSQPAIDAREILRQTIVAEEVGGPHRNWRSFQARHHQRAQQLLQHASSLRDRQN